MILLVLGGAASGKSEYAEGRILKQNGRLVYLATMEPVGETAASRIKRHRDLRKGKGFETVEQPWGLDNLSFSTEDAVLLECVSNLYANEMFHIQPPLDAMEAARNSLDGIVHICQQAGDVVIVSNNIFDDGCQYDPETTAYLDGMAWLNCRLAELADEVVEVVCGIPITQKNRRRV